MKNVHDLAHGLADALKQSTQYRRLKEASDKLGHDENALQMVLRFHNKQMEVQKKQLRGEDLSEEDREELRRLGELLDLKPLIREYLEAQAQMGRLVWDVQNILSEAIDLDVPSPASSSEEANDTRQ